MPGLSINATVHLPNKYLVSAYSVLDIVLSTGHTAVS